MSAPLHCVAVHPHQPDFLATGAGDGSISIWDVRNTKWPINRSKAHSGNGTFYSFSIYLLKFHTVWQIAFHPRAPNYVLSCSLDGNLLFWDFNASKDITKGTFTAEQDNITVAELIHNKHSINSFDINPDLKTVICGTDNESLVVRNGIL